MIGVLYDMVQRNVIIYKRKLHHVTCHSSQKRSTTKLGTQLLYLESYVARTQAPPHLTCDAIFITKQPELINDAEHLDDIAGEEGQLLRDAGQELEHSAHHRPRFHHSLPGEEPQISTRSPTQILASLCGF